MRLAQGALLLLLFQISHFLEEKFTARAQGSLERLFAAMPSQATVVTMASSGSGPDLAAAQRVLVGTVRVGQLVLVKPGEQVGAGGLAGTRRCVYTYLYICPWLCCACCAVARFSPVPGT